MTRHATVDMIVGPRSFPNEIVTVLLGFVTSTLRAPPIKETAKLPVGLGSNMVLDIVNTAVDSAICVDNLFLSSQLIGVCGTLRRIR